MKLNYTWVKEWGILIFLWSIIIFRMKHIVFLCLFWVLPHVQTHPHGGKSLFKSLSTMIYLIYTWGVTFKVPLDMQSGYRKT
jgi:hypothetical protein